MARVLVALLGVAMVLWSLSSVLLGIVGEKAAAQITSIRRQGGERADGVPGRYTYAVGYSFTLPTGRVVHGNTTRIGEATYMKVQGPLPVRTVRYLKRLPWINALQEDTRPSLGHAVLLFTGGFLVYAMINR